MNVLFKNILLIFSAGLFTGIQGQSISSLLPAPGVIADWEPAGEVEYVSGKDLYLLIDGGAEIFHEYGFRSAVFQTYGSTTGSLINLEIYEMADTTAAYGMYTFKTGARGISLDLGCQGMLATYYLNFWSNNYLITIIGMDTSQEVLKGVRGIADYLDDRLPCLTGPPTLTRYLPRRDLEKHGITYVKGNLGLFNQYLFDRKNIFGLREGVIGNYTDHILMIFQYTNPADVQKWYGHAKGQIQSNPLFSGFSDKSDHFICTDRDAQLLSIKPYQKWIIVVIGDPEVAFEGLLNEVEKNLGLHYFRQPSP